MGFLVVVILSTIHQGHREAMSDHDEKERLKGEHYGESLIEKDIKHREKIMQDSNQYNNDKHYNKHHNKHHDEWNNDDDEDSYSIHHKWAEDNDPDDREYNDINDTNQTNDDRYGPGGKENIWPRW